MSPINKFLLQHNLRIAQNPCVSPDFCLDWPSLRTKFAAGLSLNSYSKSRFETAAGTWSLLEDEPSGDCAWRLELRAKGTPADVLAEGLSLGGAIVVFPASWENLLRLKNLVQQYDAASTIFPHRRSVHRAALARG
jgi:hypothetical protein